MLSALITILILGVILFIVWYVVGLLIKNDTIMNAIGIVLGLILLLFALRELGIGGRLIS